MQISACYIVKNEAENLPRSIASLRQAVDEIIVVDTGSTDETKSAALRYGARVYDFCWQDDFAMARNFALDQADSDWIIFLDADEYFCHPSKVRESIVRIAAENTGIDAIMLSLLELDMAADGKEMGRDVELRIFRHLPELRYQGRIHENIQREGGELRLYYAGEELMLCHTGYSSDKMEQKLQRNLRLLQQDIAEHGEGPQHYYFLADCYFGLHDDERALAYACRAIQHPAAVDNSRMYHVAIESMRQLGRPLLPMLQYAVQAIEAFPELPEFYAEAGMILSAMGKLAEAQMVLRKALSLAAENPAAARQYTSYFTAEAAAKVRQRLQEVEALLSAGSVKITACYIVKNEEGNLRRSLESIVSAVDELIVVDTGSADATKKIAADFGARILDFDWQDDFSAARNAALEQADGDWIVFLDADEYFTAETAGNLRAVIEAQQEKPQTGLLIKLLNVDRNAADEVLGYSYALRIFRNRRELRYAGRIHEELRNEGQAVQPLLRIAEQRLLLIHTGYSAVISREKAERNLQMLLKELETGTEPQILYGYLADAYFGLDNWEKAEYYARLDIAGGRRATTYASHSYRMLLEMLAGQKGREAERREAASAAVRDFPEIPEFHADYAECLAAQGKYIMAVGEMRLALQWFAKPQGMEPTMFNEKMAKIARQRLKGWEMMTDTVKQLSDGPEPDAQVIIQSMEQLFMARLYCIETGQQNDMPELLPAGLEHILQKYGQSETSLDAAEQEAYGIVLPWVFKRGTRCMIEKFAQLAENFDIPQLAKFANLFFVQEQWQAALLLYARVPAEHEAVTAGFWHHTGICFFHLGQKDTARECLQKAMASGCAVGDTASYLSWCEEG